MDIKFTIVIDLIGTYAFAISGIRLAAGKNIDWFGAYILGLVTAIGGGTFRDLLLGIQPFWMLDSKYFLTTAVALFSSLILKEKLFQYDKTLLLFDTIGLGLFTIVGIEKSADEGLPNWVCIVMGTITGSLGGVLRDVLLNDVPVIFRKEIYALACVAGGVTYFFCMNLNLHAGVPETIGASAVIAFRLIAVKYHIQLPILQHIDEKNPKKD